MELYFLGTVFEDFAWTEQKRQLYKHNNLKREQKNQWEEGEPFWGLM